MIANDRAGLRTGAAIDPTLSMVPMQALMKWLSADGARTEEAERQAVPVDIDLRHLPPEKPWEAPLRADAPAIPESVVDAVPEAPKPSYVPAFRESPAEKRDTGLRQPARYSAPVLPPEPTYEPYEPMPALPPALVMPLQTGEQWEPWAEETDVFEEPQAKMGFFASLPSVFDNLISPPNLSADQAAPSRLLGIFAFASIVLALGSVVYLLRLS